MASVSKKTAEFLAETDKWVAEQQASDRNRSALKELRIIPFLVTLAIGAAVVHFAL